MFFFYYAFYFQFKTRNNCNIAILQYCMYWSEYNKMQLQEIEFSQNQSKQLNTIRKAAIQSLQPVITKIEQNIAFLIAETTKLREKNQLLERTVMDHGALNLAIAEVRNDMTNVTARMNQVDSKINKDGISLRGELVNMSLDIENLASALRQKQQKIVQLANSQSQQTKLSEAASESYKQMFQTYTSQVLNLESTNRSLSQNLNKLTFQFDTQIQLIKESIHLKDDKIQQCTDKLGLYLTEREESRALSRTLWQKLERTVDVDRYEQDWRTIRAENQELKRVTKKTVDEALTPDVRKFLPQMMQRIQEVRKVNKLQIFVNQQKAQMDSFQQQQSAHISQLRQLIGQCQTQSENIQKELQTDTANLFTDFSTKLHQNTEKVNESIREVEEEIIELVFQKESELRQDISELLQKNKEIIYQMVVELIPQEEKLFYAKMKEFLPLLESTKIQILDRCEQITEFGRGLEERLENFNNRIVKIKGDLSVEIEGVKKKTKLMESAIDTINNNFKSTGKVISAYCELLLLQYSLSFDPQQKQVYVTGVDGIIYQYSGDNSIMYRKLKTFRDQIRRCALANLIKLTDSLIGADEYGFMCISQNKPSWFFQDIRDSILLTQPIQLPNYKKERRLSGKIRDGSVDNKLPLIDPSQVKTIDLSQNELLKERQVHSITSDLSTAKKKERSYRGRYSQMK